MSSAKYIRHFILREQDTNGIQTIWSLEGRASRIMREFPQMQ